MTLAADIEADLVERAKAGDNDAFAELRRAFGLAVYGCIRCRSRTDTDAEDVQQDTWLLVLTHIRAFDRARAPFEAFAKYWAGIALARFYRNAWRSVVLISTLIERYSGLSEADIWDLIAPPRPARPSRARPSRKKAAARSAGNKPQVVRVGEVRRTADTCDLAAYDRALRETFKHPIPPHQYVVFGFMQLLEWRPRELAAEFSAAPLRKLEIELEDQFAGFVPGDRVRPSFAVLRECMLSEFGRLALDPNTRKTHQGLLQRVVGDTLLSEYCSRSLTACISHWWLAVARRVAKSPAGRALMEHTAVAGKAP